MSLRNHSKRVKIGLVALLALIVGASTLLAVRWPYTPERLIPRIETSIHSRVRVQQFHSTFFPQPGCTLENVVIDRQTEQPIAQAEKVQIRSSWLSVLTFRKHISNIEAQRLRVHIPPVIPPPVDNGHSGGLGNVLIKEFVADGATVTATGSDQQERRFVIHQLRLRNVGAEERLNYAALVDLPDPPSQLSSTGTIGPFSSGGITGTPVAGSFELRHGNLAKYKGLTGSIDARGKFQGPFENVRVTGTAVASQFQVNRSGHPLDIQAA